MKIEQATWSPADGWVLRRGALNGAPAHFVLAFGGRHLLEDPARYIDIRSRYPGARVLIASTAGEITDVSITEEELTLVAVAMEKTEIDASAVTITHPEESYELGAELARRLTRPELAHIFVLSEGSLANGNELVRGFNRHLPPGVTVTGGLAGDGPRFERTLVGLDEPPRPGRIAALAFYGSHFKSSFGSADGWSPFGPERVITCSMGNRLCELDDRSALDLYRQYLGDQAAGLPGSALRFPLSLSLQDGSPTVVRTILSVDEANRCLVFAGDMPVGGRVRFMHASYEDIIDGAAAAADLLKIRDHELVICVSCVGRLIVLGQRTEEEMDVVRDCVGPRAIITGFYSYGELAPAMAGSSCQLHNQTMTITGFSET